MDASGLTLCCRYSYPPNSFSLCGPEKQADLHWYAATQQPTAGIEEILVQFGTLYPYLSLIAHENNVSDPFDRRVIEAYWLGNKLLSNVAINPFVTHLSDKLLLKKKLKPSELAQVYGKIAKGALPHHSFHVLNIYKRTGNVDTMHTVQTMDACIINWGWVTGVGKNKITVNSQPLTVAGNNIVFGKTRERVLYTQGTHDVLAANIHRGDWISYHWGYFCQKLSAPQLKNLMYYTQLSINFANLS